MACKPSTVNYEWANLLHWYYYVSTGTPNIICGRLTSHGRTLTPTLVAPGDTIEHLQILTKLFPDLILEEARRPQRAPLFG